MFALGQVVISAVLNMESYIPEIQERLRKSGYPRFERLELQTLRFEARSNPRMQTDTRWLFINRDDTGLVSINTHSVVLERSEYGSFDDFASELAAVLAQIQEVIDVEITDRLGFRRVNLIEGQDDLPLTDALSGGLLGIDAGSFADAAEHRYEFWADTPVGRLMVRTSHPVPEDVLPDDLLPSRLIVRRPAVPTRAATVDIDHFMVEPADFSAENIIESFWKLHDASDQAFRSAVTEAALEAWQKGGPS